MVTADLIKRASTEELRLRARTLRRVLAEASRKAVVTKNTRQGEFVLSLIHAELDERGAKR